MSSEQLLLVMTAVLAVVALLAAFIAVRAARRAGNAPESSLLPQSAQATVHASPTEILRASSASVHSATSSAATEGPLVTIIEGRVIVAPTSRQIVDATMSRPLVRVSVISHGLAHALRPESRDRIMALMRREFQSRRRQRKRAAKQAARIEHPKPPRAIGRAAVTSEAWLGELPTPQPATYNRQVES